jgi:hypothetical protein
MPVWLTRYCEAMKSVPPRGSGWVDDRAAERSEHHLTLSQAILFGNRPTRYRAVVLTSSPPNTRFVSNPLTELYRPFDRYSFARNSTAV